MRSYVTVYLLRVMTLSASLSSVFAQDSKDYCLWEKFHAKCERDEVIIMKSAVFGRMHQGRCVKGNYGYLGCSRDVLEHMDSVCSGRRECSFEVPDAALRAMNPCAEDIAPYLEASFSCLQVHHAKQSQCIRYKNISITKPSGFLSSESAVHHNVGVQNCPWYIKVPPGQHINVTFYNFARDSSSWPSATDSSHQRKHGVCYEVATIKEYSSVKTVTLCDGVNRKNYIYTSQGNNITIQFVSKPTLETLGYFLFRHEAVGCPVLKAPAHTILHIKGSNATIKCNSTGQTWYLHCDGKNWKGQTGNCSSGAIKHALEGEAPFPYGILLIVAIGVALGVFCGGILLSLIIFYMKRKNKSRASLQEDVPMDTRQQQQQAFTPDFCDVHAQMHFVNSPRFSPEKEQDFSKIYDLGHHPHAIHRTSQPDLTTYKTMRVHACPQNCSTLQLSRHLYEFPQVNE